MCRLWLTIVPPWERRALAGAGASPEQGRCAIKMTHRPALGEVGPVRIRCFSQARTACRKIGSSSRLGRVLAAGAWNWQVFCATSRLWRNLPIREGDGSGVLAGRGVGSSRRLSQAGILRRPISPKQGRCAGIDPIPGWRAGASPKQGRCALASEHRPRSGETAPGRIRCFSQARTLRTLRTLRGLSSRLRRGGPTGRWSSPKSGRCAGMVRVSGRSPPAGC